VKDVDFAARLLVVREGKGAKDRRTMLPDSLQEALRSQIDDVRRIHRKDLAAGRGEVWLPNALDRKYSNAGRELAWQYVFPASRGSMDPRSGIERRHHLDESAVQRAVKEAGGRRESTGRRAATLCGIRSPRIFSKMDTTSARFRSCSGTRT
jgi:integrase